MTTTNEIQALTFDELDRVSGGALELFGSRITVHVYQGMLPGDGYVSINYIHNGTNTNWNNADGRGAHRTYP